MAASPVHGEHDDEKLPGTFAVVLFVALVIIVIWVAVFVLFLSRY